MGRSYGFWAPIRIPVNRVILRLSLAATAGAALLVPSARAASFVPCAGTQVGGVPVSQAVPAPCLKPFPPCPPAALPCDR